jgi:hypothetical protein
MRRIVTAHCQNATKELLRYGAEDLILLLSLPYGARKYMWRTWLPIQYFCRKH